MRENYYQVETMVFGTKAGLVKYHARIKKSIFSCISSNKGLPKVFFLSGQCMNHERAKNLSIITKSGFGNYKKNEEVKVIR